MAIDVFGIKRELNSFVDRHEAITNAAIAENRDLTSDEIAELEQLEQSAQSHRIKLDAVNRANKTAAANKAVAMLDGKDESKLPAKARAVKSACFASDFDAFATGQWARALFAGDQSAHQWCRRNGVIENAMTTGDNNRGGFIVPDRLEDAIIELRTKYSLFRQFARQHVMSDGVCLVPKLLGEATTYYVNENSDIPASDLTLGQIRLEARKLAGLTVFSSELSEDAAISLGDTLARSFAQQFALAEDQAGFLGDGSSTYGGIVGLAGALASGSKITASGSTASALTMADFEKCIGLAKVWQGAKPQWFMSQQCWANGPQRLLDAYAGNSIVELVNGAEKRFLGYPVQISQVMASGATSSTGQSAAYFGDLEQGVYFGTRRGLNVAIDASRYFVQDALALRCTERYDIVVHDTGSSSDSGGIVALVFA